MATFHGGIMLILTRKRGESVLIGDGIEIKILGPCDGKYGDGVKLGIEAPREMPIIRKELVDRVVERRGQQ